MKIHVSSIYDMNLGQEFQVLLIFKNNLGKVVLMFRGK
jgi:hypothetical protein